MQMSIRENTETQQMIVENRIIKLKQMLANNKAAQHKLLLTKQTIENRWKQLQQIGSLNGYKTQTQNQIFDYSSAINQVKKIPASLEDQLLLKKNTAQQYGFLKNITEEKQPSSKHKKSKFVELDISSLGPNPRAINFVDKAIIYGKTGLQLYKEWREFYQAENNRIITSQDPDEQRLLQKRKIYGDNWQKIGYFFNGFNFQKLYYYFQKNLNKIQPGKWTLRQNLMLIVLVDYYGHGKWASIAKKLKVKSQFQIRQRFCNILDPTIKQNKWTGELQKLLLQVAPEKQYRWSCIVKQIPQFQNKTDNALRRKFRNLMIKCSDNQIKQRISNQDLFNSIIKFKKSYYNRKKKKITEEQPELDQNQ